MLIVLSCFTELSLPVLFHFLLFMLLLTDLAFGRHADRYPS
jgi:hypothetical protein